MAVRDHTDADFNASSRQVEYKLEVYFDATPVTMTKDDYLISVDITEEVAAESSDPIGAVSANVLNVSLLNTNGIFNPQNTSGTYYGKIKTGIIIKPYLRLLDSVDTLNWIPLGVFYVREWYAELLSTKATVYATDNMEDVFKQSCEGTELVGDYTYKQFIEYAFSVLGYTPTVSAALSTVLPFGYAEGETKSFITALMVGARAMCYSDRSGGIVVNPISVARPVRATLTDADQINTVLVRQSTLKTYDGVSLTYSLPQLTYNTEVLNIKDFKVKAGSNVYDKMTFDKGPLASLAHIAAQTLNNAVKVTDFSYTPWTLSMTMNNATASQILTALSVYGTVAEFTDTILADTGSSLLTISNKYIQDTVYAAAFKAFLNAFVSSDIPTVDVEIRGNLLLKIGDLITISSTKYNLNYTGLIWRMKTSYQGFLKSTITLVDSALVGGVA